MKIASSEKFYQMVLYYIKSIDNRLPVQLLKDLKQPFDMYIVDADEFDIEFIFNIRKTYSNATIVVVSSDVKRDTPKLMLSRINAIVSSTITEPELQVILKRALNKYVYYANQGIK